MQTLSAYLLETPELDDEGLQASHKEVISEIDRWLTSKKVVDPRAARGNFKSKTPGFPDGQFVRETTEAASGHLLQIALTEASGKGQNIETRINVVLLQNRISVHVQVNVYNIATILMPARINLRCPKIIHHILRLPIHWLLNGEPAPSWVACQCVGENDGRAVADELLSSTRSAPIVLVSKFDGAPVWDDLPSHLALDLAGLAHVYEIDDDAAYTIKEEIGHAYRCVGGTVRLYWPQIIQFGRYGSLNSIYWRTSALVDMDYDGHGEERFRDIIRHKVMSVAAQTVLPPRGIHLIQNAAANAFVEGLRARQSHDIDPDTLQIVELYAQQNEQLRRDLETAREAVSSLTAQNESAKYAIQQLSKNRQERATFDEDESADGDDEFKIPVAGEVRFTKKTGSSGPYDRMVPFGGCNHSSWEPMGNAPKALKGLQRLFKDNTDWKRVDKCLSCTGGGVWRVTW